MQTPPASEDEYLRSDRFRTFKHADGREWRVRVADRDVQIVMVLPGGERFEKSRPNVDNSAARQALKDLVREQLAAGFIETTFDCLIYVRDATRLWKERGGPSEETLTLVVRFLKHDDFRIAVGAAKLLAEHATVDGAFEPLWAARKRAEHEDGFAWALMRAAEVRRDPLMRGYLESMLDDRRFASRDYRERIREALAGLR